MVTLKQLEGRRQTRTGHETIKQPVDGVYVDGQHVGWIDRMSGARLSFIRRLQPAQYQDIHKAVVQLRKGTEFGPPADTFNAVPFVPQEIMAKYAPDPTDDIEDDDDE